MNNMKYIFLWSFLLFFTNTIFSQDCDLKSDTLYFVKIDIRSNDDYSIIMNGLCSKINFESLNTKDELSFLGDFYKNAFFCPELIFGAMNKIRISCDENKKCNILSEKEIFKICKKIERKSIKKNIMLHNGKYVNISVTKIISNFWVVKKGHEGLSTNSSEINIQEIEEIKYCYIPFKIKRISKPNNDIIDNVPR